MVRFQYGGRQEHQWIRRVVLERVERFVQSLTSAFTISYIQKRFPNFSAEQIHLILEKLLAEGKVEPILEDNQLKWVSVAEVREPSRGEMNRPKVYEKARRERIKTLQGNFMRIQGVLEVIEIQNQGERLNHIKRLQGVTEQEFVQIEEGVRGVRSSLASVGQQASQSQEGEGPQNVRQLLQVTERELRGLQAGLRNSRGLVEKSEQINQEFHREFEAFKGPLREAEQKLNRIWEEFESIARLRKLTVEEVRQFEERFQDAQASLQLLRKQIAQLREIYHKGRNLIERAEGEINQIQGRIQETKESKRRVEGEMREFQEEVGGIRGFIEAVGERLGQVREAVGEKFNQVHETISGLSLRVASVEANEVMSSIKRLRTPFTVLDVEGRSSGLSVGEIYRGLLELSEQGQVKFVLQDGQLKWLRSGISSEQSFMQVDLTDIKRSGERSVEASKIGSFVEMLVAPFDIPYIMQKFPGLSVHRIYKALVELTAYGELRLVLQGGQLKWVRSDKLPERGMIWEEVVERNNEVFRSSNGDTIMPYMEEVRKAVSIEDIRGKFQNFSDMTIEDTLFYLEGKGKVMMLEGKGEGRSGLWISTGVMHERNVENGSRGFTIRDAIDEYYGRVVDVNGSEGRGVDRSEVRGSSRSEENGLRVRDPSSNGLKSDVSENTAAVGELFRFARGGGF